MESFAGMGMNTGLMEIPISTRLGYFGLCCFLSVIPDLDAVPAVFFGDLAAYHNFYSHSVFVLLGVSVVVAYIVKTVLPITYRRAFVLTFGSCMIHILMDQMCYGRGQLTFWPVSYERYSLPFTLFYGLRWSEGWVSYHHLITACQELSFGILLIFLMQRYVFRED